MSKAGEGQFRFALWYTTRSLLVATCWIAGSKSGLNRAHIRESGLGRVQARQISPTPSGFNTEFWPQLWKFRRQLNCHACEFEWDLDSRRVVHHCKTFTPINVVLLTKVLCSVTEHVMVSSRRGRKRLAEGQIHCFVMCATVHYHNLERSRRFWDFPHFSFRSPCFKMYDSQSFFKSARGVRCTATVMSRKSCKSRLVNKVLFELTYLGVIICISTRFSSSVPFARRSLNNEYNYVMSLGNRDVFISVIFQS